MRVYFVRHGESIENTTGIYKGGSAELTEDGKTQAGFVAERFLKIPIDIILSSDMERAKMTASVISEKVGIGVTHSKLLEELSAPSELLEKDSDDPKTIAIRDAWFAHNRKREDEKSQYSDEESFYDAKKRAEKALAYIIKRKENDILVVTHGTFLRVMLIVMFEKTLRINIPAAKHFPDFRDFLIMSNTGITVCDYIDGNWKLITWNDNAHLG